MVKTSVALVLWGLTALAPSTVHPAAYTLTGTVVDRVEGVPIEGARVTLVTNGRDVRTSASGGFQFGPRPLSGPDDLLVAHPGYRTVRIPLGDLGDEEWHLDITMERAPPRGDGYGPTPGGSK